MPVVPTIDPEFPGEVRLIEKSPPLHSDGDGGNSNGMNDRISRLEGQHDGIKHSQGITIAVVGAVSAIMIGGFAIVIGMQLQTNARVDALGDTIRTEFNAMRAEMAAQTSAIANSITATKQQAPQVILVPPPQPTR